jgi:hypothetical protein
MDMASEESVPDDIQGIIEATRDRAAAKALQGLWAEVQVLRSALFAYSTVAAPTHILRTRATVQGGALWISLEPDDQVSAGEFLLELNGTMTQMTGAAGEHRGTLIQLPVAGGMRDGVESPIAGEYVWQWSWAFNHHNHLGKRVVSAKATITVPTDAPDGWDSGWI